MRVNGDLPGVQSAGWLDIDSHESLRRRTEHNRSFYNTRWRNTDWLTAQVITEWMTFSLPGDTTVFADKMFWAYNKPAQWTFYRSKVEKSKAITVTGHAGTYSCDTSKLPHFSRKSAYRWRWGCQPYAPVALYLQENSLCSFLLEAETTPRPQRAWKD
jgi:hypothetical protein